MILHHNFVPCRLPLSIISPHVTQWYDTYPRVTKPAHLYCLQVQEMEDYCLDGSGTPQRWIQSQIVVCSASVFCRMTKGRRYLT